MFDYLSTMNNDMHFGQGGQFNQCGQKHQGCAWILKFGFRFTFETNNFDLKFHRIRSLESLKNLVKSKSSTLLHHPNKVFRFYSPKFKSIC